MEYKDSYDQFRNKTGKAVARGVSSGSDDYFLAVRIWIVNRRGELLIQQRQHSKQRWPNLWDCAVAGGVRQGETSLQAALRESSEELGLILRAQDLEHLFTAIDTQRYDDIMLLRKDIDARSLVLQAEEVAAARWATFDEVRALLAAGQFVPYSFFDYFSEVLASNLHFAALPCETANEQRYRLFCNTTPLSELVVSCDKQGGLSVKLGAVPPDLLAVILKRTEAIYPQSARCTLTVAGFSDDEWLDCACASMGYYKATQGGYCKDKNLYKVRQHIFL